MSSGEPVAVLTPDLLEALNDWLRVYSVIASPNKVLGVVGVSAVEAITARHGAPVPLVKKAGVRNATDVPSPHDAVCIQGR